MVESLPSAICLRDLRVPLVFLSAVCSFTVVAGLPTDIGNITLPDGSTNHGDPHLICTPTTWIDIFIFYFGNYFAHAITIPAFPGEPRVDFIINAIITVLFPTAGIARGIDAIIRHSAWVEGGELQKAARAGALRMVIRSKDWEPAAGDHIRDAKLERPSAAERGEIIVSTYMPDWLLTGGWKYWPSIHGDGDDVFESKNLHGLHRLPPGYSFAMVPHDARVEDIGPLRGETDICSVFNFPQVAAALVQSIYAAVTLYNSRGDQINRYGYAAFSLTVAPYVFMSVINLIGALLTSTYPTMYLIGSSVMDEAKSRPGAWFDGVIGRISETIPVTDVRGTFEDQPAGSGLFFSRAGGSSGVGEELPVLTPRQSLEVVRAERSQEHLVLRIPSCNKFQRIDSIHHASHAPTVAHSESRPHAAMDMSTSRLHGAVDRSPLAVARYSREQQVNAMVICWVFESIPIAIVGGLSGFHPRESTTAQRVWVMLWLVIGVYIGAGVAQHAAMTATLRRELRPEDKESDFRAKSRVAMVLPVLLYGAPAVGGFIVVGKMLFQYGSCVRFG